MQLSAELSPTIVRTDEARRVLFPLVIHECFLKLMLMEFFAAVPLDLI